LLLFRYVTESNRRSEYDIVGLNSVKYSLVNVTLHRLYTLLLIHVPPVPKRIITTMTSTMTTEPLSTTGVTKDIKSRVNYV